MRPPQTLLPRWLHRWFANEAGYFWLPCKSCGHEYGGHELDTAVPNVGIPVDGCDWHLTLVCPECTRYIRAMQPHDNRPMSKSMSCILIHEGECMDKNWLTP